MSKFMRYIGYIWASPLTIVGLLYVAIFSFFNWYVYFSHDETTVIWYVNHTDAPNWLQFLWKNHSGQTVGNVVVMKRCPNNEKDIMSLRHQQEHSYQSMRLGIFYPFAYALISLLIKIGTRNSDPHYSNSFEVDARRAANQIIDVEGAIKKAYKEGRITIRNK